MPRLRLIAAPAALLLALAGCAAGTDDADRSPAPTASAGTAMPGGAAAGPSAAPSGTASAPAASSSPAPGAHLDISSPDSSTVLVHKTHPMEPIDWAPQDLETVGSVQLRADAAAAARRMIEAASRDGVSLTPISGYRSHQTQETTYRQWVSTYGQERADVASARPGYSEHQTGLAVDFGGSGACDLQPCFRDTPAARWLEEHGGEYGFILRFPWQQQETTGYWYESWHLRWIGQEQAQRYRDSGATNYEEFVGAGPAPSYRD